MTNRAKRYILIIVNSKGAVDDIKSAAFFIFLIRKGVSIMNVPEIFGSDVFNESVMKERLPKQTYKALKKTINDGTPLGLDVANVVANAMKD